MQKVRVQVVFVSLFCFFVGNICLYGQLPNQVFQGDTLGVSSLPERTLVLHLDYLGYNKNNEYFNQIADGYTLFGQQALVTGKFRLAKNVALEGGVSFKRDFGQNTVSEWLPILRLKLQNEHLGFLFGTLEGHLNHGLIEPLFDFERLLDRRLENGFQFWYKKKRIQLETWVDWSQMIYEGSPFREQIDGGLNFRYRILEKNNQQLDFSVQLTGIHLGGQIDTAPEPLVTRFNPALGLVWQKDFGEENFVQKLEFHQYGLWYKDFSFNFTSVYDRGWGMYSHANIKLKHLGNIGFSYWRGTTYESSLGGDLFSSATRRFDLPPNTSESLRELLIARLINNIPIVKEKVWLSLRTEPFWDFQNQKFEFSMGLYLVYREGFSLFSLKE